MKYLTLMLLLLQMGVMASLAQTVPMGAESIQTTSLGGRVQSIDDARSIFVLASGNVVHAFRLRGDLKVYDSQGKLLQVGDLKKNDEVRVDYEIRPDSVLEAFAIYKR